MSQFSNAETFWSMQLTGRGPKKGWRAAALLPFFESIRKLYKLMTL